MCLRLTFPVVLLAFVCLGSVCSLAVGKSKYKDPVIVRADVIYDAEQGLTPNLVRAGNGDLIVHWATRGDGMPGQATKFARSSDSGKTWSKPFLTISSEKPLTGTATSFYNLPDGKRTSKRMLVYTLELVWPGEPDENKPDYLELAGGRKFDSYYSFTTDDGKTISKGHLLSDPVKRNDFAQGSIVKLPNGDLLWPWGHWDSQPLHGFKRSTDKGDLGSYTKGMAGPSTWI